PPRGEARCRSAHPWLSHLPKRKSDRAPLLNPLKPLQARRTLATLAALDAPQSSFAGSAVIDLGSERYRDARRAYNLRQMQIDASGRGRMLRVAPAHTRGRPSG